MIVDDIKAPVWYTVYLQCNDDRIKIIRKIPVKANTPEEAMRKADIEYPGWHSYDTMLNGSP